MGLSQLKPSRGHKTDETGLRSIIIDNVKTFAANAPRSLQKHIGPSQVGTPCERQLAYHLAGTEEARSFLDPWPSIVGTAVHAWLADCMDDHNRRLIAAGEEPRWHIERRVDVGLGLTGSSDCFDSITGTVIDWKILGNTQYSKYIKEGPSEVYRVQAHCYGLGYVRAGFKVERVAIGFFGRAKTLNDLHMWSEPFDMTIALKALKRMREVQEKVDAGVKPLDIAANPGVACFFCPFKVPAAEENPCGYCPEQV